MLQLTKTEIIKIFNNTYKTGTINFIKNKCEVSFNADSKVYSYNYNNNLFNLANSFKIKQTVLDNLDKVNCYNRDIIKRIENYKIEITNLLDKNFEYVDNTGFGITRSEATDYASKGLTEELIYLNNYKDNL